MTKEKKTEQICKRFKRRMQKIIDDDGGIDSVSIQVEGQPKIVVAEKQKEMPDGKEVAK